MESGRRNFVMGYDPLGCGGGTSMESGRKKYHKNDPLGWGGHSWHQEEKIIMGYDPLGWGGTFMASGRGNFIIGHENQEEAILSWDPLGWGGPSWNQEEETLSWDTRGGGFGPPPI